MPSYDYGELYGTSDIQWRPTGPKTYTLTNKPAPPDLTPQEVEHFMAGMEMRDRERVGGSYMDEPNPPALTPAEDMRVMEKYQSTPQERRGWRKQLRLFNQAMRDPNAAREWDLAGGVQELVDSGAVHVSDEGDVWTAVPIPKRWSDRLLDAVADWNDLQQATLERFGTSNDPETIQKRKDFWEMASPRWKRS